MRVTVKRSFKKEFLISFSVILFCCSTTTLLFNYLMTINANPWYFVLIISSSVIIMTFILSVIVWFSLSISFYKPISNLSVAARKVASGDYTTRVGFLKSGDKKDEMEVLIEDFNTMVEELSTVETLKSDFISNVSHELKTPLSIIQNYVSALKDENLSKDERNEYIDIITNSIKKQSALITNILRLNKLEMQEIYEKNKYSLDEQLRCVIIELEEKMNEKNIDLEIDIPEIIIESDEKLLEIVWNNLITNAIKFSNENGKITVEIKKDSKFVSVIIKDTGIGINDETKKRIFDRFYQGNTSHSNEGNGLGLSMVSRIINIVSGDIIVEDNLICGSKFTVKLPL